MRPPLFISQVFTESVYVPGIVTGSGDTAVNNANIRLYYLMKVIDK